MNSGMSIRRSHAVVTAMLIAAALVACQKKSDESRQATARPDAGPAVARHDPEPKAALDAAPAVAPAPDAAAAPPAVVAAPFLWKVEKDGVAFHILGSVHLGIEPKTLPKVVWDTAGAAKKFAMETDIEDMSMMKLALRTDGTTLEQELGPDYWKKLEDRIGKQLAAGLNSMKVFMAAATVELMMMPMTSSMDLELRNRSRDAGAEVVFLEEASLQQKLLEKWLDTKSLKEMLDDFDELKAKSQEMLAAYAAGDGDKVGELSLDEKTFLEAGGTEAEFAQMKKEMLLDRNASWIAPLEKHAAAGPLFVVVGVGHLLGEGSVLDLLQQRGWTVTRVES